MSHRNRNRKRYKEKYEEENRKPKNKEDKVKIGDIWVVRLPYDNPKRNESHLAIIKKKAKNRLFRQNWIVIPLTSSDANFTTLDDHLIYFHKGVKSIIKHDEPHSLGKGKLLKKVARLPDKLFEKLNKKILELYAN